MKTTRSELRNRIMTILYQVYLYRNDKIDYSLEEVIKENDDTNSDYVNSMVNGTLENEVVIDKLINKYMNNWTIDRLGEVDKAIFRMSSYELLYTKTPSVVAINEGIELSKKYSDEKITSMLNAVLDNILNNEVTNE